MDALRNGNCVFRANFHAASAGNAFLDADRCFSFRHDKTPFCFIFIISICEENIFFNDKVTKDMFFLL